MDKGEVKYLKSKKKMTKKIKELLEAEAELPEPKDHVNIRDRTPRLGGPPRKSPILSPPDSTVTSPKSGKPHIPKLVLSDDRETESPKYDKRESYQYKLT